MTSYHIGKWLKIQSTLTHRWRNSPFWEVADGNWIFPSSRNSSYTTPYDIRTNIYHACSLPKSTYASNAPPSGHYCNKCGKQFPKKLLFLIMLRFV